MPKFTVLSVERRSAPHAGVEFDLYTLQNPATGTRYFRRDRVPTTQEDRNLLRMKPTYLSHYYRAAQHGDKPMYGNRALQLDIDAAITAYLAAKGSDDRTP